MIEYHLDLSNIKGIKIYLEGYSIRIPVGELRFKDNKYILTYYKRYLRYKRAIPIAYFDLRIEPFEYDNLNSLKYFLRRVQIETSMDKLFKINEVSAGEVFSLLCTKGKVSKEDKFIFVPILDNQYKGENMRQFMETFGVSVKKFCDAFNMSFATFIRLETNNVDEKNYNASKLLNLIEIFQEFPEVAIFYIEKYGEKLHPKVKDKIISKLHKNYYIKSKRVPLIPSNDLNKAVDEYLENKKI